MKEQEKNTQPKTEKKETVPDAKASSEQLIKSLKESDPLAAAELDWLTEGETLAEPKPEVSQDTDSPTPDHALESAEEALTEKTVKESADKKPEVQSENVTETNEESKQDAFIHPLENRKSSFAFRQMVSNFAGCGRCSYFMAQIRIMHGEEVLEKAVASMQSGQLLLPWVYEMRQLLVKSYGLFFNTDFVHFNGSCPECRRPFTYKSNDAKSADEADNTFAIELGIK